MRKCNTDDLPTRNAFLTWKKLKERFDPQTSNEKLQLKENSTNSKLTEWKKSPDDWIAELGIITSQFDQMGHKTTDKDFMIHILGNIPEEYKGKIETLEKGLDHRYDPLTVEKMTNKLSMKYRKICKKNDYDPDEDEKEKERK